MSGKLILPLLCLTAVLCFSACSPQKEDPKERSAIQARVDSLAAIQIDSANNAINAACNRRLATEVNALADSLVNAAKAHSSR